MNRGSLSNLVGLLILTLGMTALLAAFSGNAGGLRRSEQRMLAVATAQSLMQEAGVRTPLVPGHREGVTADGLPWHIEISARPGDDILGTLPRIDAFWISVTVADGQSQVRLTNLKIAQSP